MAELLTAWENALLHMQIGDYMELNPCECEGTCTCEEDQCSPS